jgi:CDGSH-type Zn-finger protein
MLAWIFLFVVLAFVGKLVYDVQQKKNKPTQTEDGFDKDKFQKLAGIIPTNPNDELRQFLVNNNIIDEEKLKEELRKGEFPAPDPSIPVTTAKLTTIGGSYSDSDPLASVPMSRVSNEGKKKMAEIAKEDISIQLEQNAEKFATLTNQTKCGCGRSETGFCTGLHRIPKKDWAAGVREIPAEKPKRKTTKKTK